MTIITSTKRTRITTTEATSTPAPAKLDDLSIQTVKDLIEAIPPDSKLQNIIGQYKDKYPSTFEGVVPKPLSSLTKEAQEKRQT